MTSIQKRRLALLAGLLLASAICGQIILGQQRAVMTVANNNSLTNDDLSLEQLSQGSENLGPQDAYDAVIEHPLFLMSRVKTEEKPDQIKRKNNKVPAVSLIGVILTPDIKSVLLRSADKKIINLKLGEEIQGWRLNEIHGHRVVLEKEARKHELQLLQQDSAKKLTRPRSRR